MGERVRTIGIEAEAKAWKFIEALGYRILETNIEKYDIDGLARFDPRETALGLAKPRYAPDGLTAFEITEEPLGNGKIRKFQDKISRYNERHHSFPIDGGVIVVDQKIALPTIRSMRDRRIWCWERSRMRLYREKISTFNSWISEYKSATEVIVDDWASNIRASSPPPTSSEKLLYFAVFFDDIENRLTAKRLKLVMNKIRVNSLLPVLQCGVRPINAYFAFYSVGGLAGHLREAMWRDVIGPWKAEQITVFTATEPFNDYRTLPALTIE